MSKDYPSIDYYFLLGRFRDLVALECAVPTTFGEQTELGTFFSILYLSPSKERRSVELLDLLYFIKRFRWGFLFTLPRSVSQDFLWYSIDAKLDDKPSPVPF